MPDFLFKPEATQFFDTFPQFREDEDQELVSQFSKKLDVGGFDTFVIIPCYVKEPGVYESLKAHAEASPPDKCLFVVFINASEYSIASDEFEILSAQREVDIDRAAADFPSLKLKRFTHHFSGRAIISRIRGIITDAVLKSCFEQQVTNPVIISNDADALAYAPDYVTNMANCFRNASQIDYASGPIWWSGCDPSGLARYSPAQAMPEIYINDYFGQFGDEIYRQTTPVYTTGCNSAFRGASLCGIRSYNYTFAPSYDLEIGRFFNMVREKVFGDDPRLHGAFVRECVLTTNPRRAAIAILGNVPFGMQFDNFGSVIGADIGLAECIAAYQGTSKFLQLEELLETDDAAVLAKVRLRIINVFWHFLRGEPTDNRKALAEMIAPRAGLVLEDVEFDGKNVLDITVDWDRSTLVQHLVDWAKLNVSQQEKTRACK